MRAPFTLILLIWLAAVPRLQAQESLAESNNKFALDLYARTKSEKGNFFLSPYSILSAFAMCHAGARGDTREQLARALHLAAPSERVGEDFAEFNRGLHKIQENGDITIGVANSLWVQQGYKFLPGYLSAVGKHHDAEISNVDFAGDSKGVRKKINEWTAAKTANRITGIVPPNGLSPDTKMALVNAIYFKGDWSQEFQHEATRDEPFWITPERSVDWPLMWQKQSFLYAENTGTKLLVLPYKGEELSMVILLPTEKGGLEDLENRLSVEYLKNLLGAARTEETHVCLPKFTLDGGFELNELMQALGAKDAFDQAAADFSGMDGSRNLFISAALHKAWIKVDEKGTEAAAATAIVGEAGAMPREDENPPKVFRADHPFVFFIRENNSGAILFAGRVSDPSKD